MTNKNGSIGLVQTIRYLLRKEKKMRKITPFLIVLLALLVSTSGALAGAGASKNFVTHLSGTNEVPARDTLAQGNVIFHFDGAALNYKLIVANIENVAAAHIHCAAAGVNGPVGVTLFVGTAGSGRFDGVLARGTALAPDAGNACGWDDMDEVVDAMLSGNTYVNVHTNDGVAPTNTGPGDFPGGEVRGQIVERGLTP
jgi:hypothetical protein